MDQTTRLIASLQEANLPSPKTTWLQTLLSTRNPQTPLPSLLATIKARLLAADLTSPNLLDPSTNATLPIPDPSVPETRLSHNVHVQVLDIEDMSQSRWQQVEELEAIERGEMTKGREVIRIQAEEGDDDAQVGRTAVSGSGSKANSTHRLVLQDRVGTRVFALELKRVQNIGIGRTHIGEKILLRKGTVVSRGMVLLEPESCVILGGKIDEWEKKWVAERLKRLREAVVGQDVVS